MPGIDVSNISLELAKIVVKNGKVDLNLLEGVASGNGMYSQSLVFEANNILMSALNGDKAWGDIGDQFIKRNNNLPVDESTYIDMLNDFWDNCVDINFVRAFHSEWQRFIEDNKDRIEGKYIPNYGLSNEAKAMQDKLPVIDLLRGVLNTQDAMLYSENILYDSLPSKANYQMLKDGLSLISELYSEFKQSVSNNILPNMNVQALKDELEQLSKSQECTQKRINKINAQIAIWEKNRLGETK